MPPVARFLAGARVIAPEGLLDPGWVGVEGGLIVGAGSGEPPAGTDDVVDRIDGYLMPGFIDVHCHGGGGGSYTSADPEQVREAARTHLKHGTTTTNASLVAASHDDLVTQVRALVPHVDDGTLHGIHLEGPWISPDYCGAHDPAVLRPPDPAEVADILAAGEGRIAMVTLAPELPGALESVEIIVASGAVAAVGHTAATADDVRRAVEAGATVATHLFNAMPPLLHRDPGPVGALLSDARIRAEIICDGVHLSPDVAALVLSTGRAMLVTDAMAAAGAGDGRYRLGHLDVVVAGGEARLADTGTLAGSTLFMDAAFRVAAEQARAGVVAASRAASETPALALGLDDRGRIAAGQRADLVVMDDSLALSRVMRGGEWVRRDGDR